MLNKDDEKIIANGIYRFILPYFISFLIIFSITSGYKIITNDKDSTDPPNGRSGMVIKIDNLTGCQYLESYQGLTPRMDPDGKQICE